MIGEQDIGRHFCFDYAADEHLIGLFLYCYPVSEILAEEERGYYQTKANQELGYYLVPVDLTGVVARWYLEEQLSNESVPRYAVFPSLDRL